MRDIFFALWGGSIASAWWMIGALGLTGELQGLSVFAALFLSGGLLGHIIMTGINERDR